MSYLKQISECLDNILDVPAEQWSQKEINLYHLLELSLDKYRFRYSLAQFKLDVECIINNIHLEDWYQTSQYKKTLDWCLDQLKVKSFQRNKKTQDFKVVVRFIKVQVEATIMFKNDQFYMILKSPVHETDLKDLKKVAEIFGINNKEISDQHKKKVALEIVKIIEEIAIFYTPEIED